MRKVLVTGGSGFIGAPAASLLARRGYEVVAVCRSPGFRLEGVRTRRANLLIRQDIDALLAEEKPDTLLHLAWIATPGVYQNAQENLHWAREGLYLLERFAQCGGRRAVMAGTCFEYDLSYGYLREGMTPERPDTLYGAAKLSLSVLARAYADRIGLPLCWARIFYLMGEGEYTERAVPYAIRAALGGGEIVCQAPLAVRDYMSENECARALCAALEGDVTGVVNIASGAGVAMGELFSFIAGETGASRLLRLGTQAAKPAVVLGDAQRLRGELGFTPREGWREAAARCVRWWKAHI